MSATPGPRRCAGASCSSAAAVDTVTGLDNRDAIFPIHRERPLRAVDLPRRPPDNGGALPVRHHQRRTNSSAPADRSPLLLTRRSSAGCLATTTSASRSWLDRATCASLERITAACPRLGDGSGWAAQLRARAECQRRPRRVCRPTRPWGTARPVVEGKQIDPFRVSLDRCRWQLRRDAATRAGAAADAARLSRRRQRRQPAHADRRHRAGRRR